MVPAGPHLVMASRPVGLRSIDRRAAKKKAIAPHVIAYW